MPIILDNERRMLAVKRNLQQPQRLVIVIIVSVFIHGGILFLTGAEPDTPLQKIPLAESMLRVHLIPWHDPVAVKDPERHEHTVAQDEAILETPDVTTPQPEPVSSLKHRDPAKDKMVVSPQRLPATIQAPAETEKPRKKQQSAQQLITRSLDMIRSQELAETPGQTFGMLAPDPRLSLPGGDKRYQAAVQSYRLPSGNLWVKIKSPLGGFQCFEVKEPDPTNELSVGAWMFTRC